MGNLLPSLGRRKLPMLEMPKVGGGDIPLGGVLYGATTPGPQYSVCDGGFAPIANPAAFPFPTTFQQAAVAAKAISNPPSGTRLTSGAINGNTIVFGDNNAYLYVSTDGGQTFSRSDTFYNFLVPLGISGVGAICYAFGLWIVGTYNGNLHWSADLVNWTRTYVRDGDPYGIADICFAKGIVIAVGGNQAYLTSTDGKTWTNRSGTLVGQTSAVAVRFANDRFFFSNFNSRAVSYSYDGINWTSCSFVGDSGGSNPSSRPCYPVAYGNGIYVFATNEGGNFCVYTSADGVTFTYRGYVKSGQANIYDLVFTAGAFIAGGPAGGSAALPCLIFSYDGVNWGNIPGPDTSTSLYVYKIVYSQEAIWAALGSSPVTLWAGPLAKASFKTPNIPSIISKAGAVLRAFMRIS